MIVGWSQEPSFGRVLTVGVGGTMVEVLDETACRVLPVSREDLRSAIFESKLDQLLVRHRAGARDVEAPVTTVARFAELVVSEDVIEADLSPVIVGVAGAVVVDSRMRRSRAPEFVGQYRDRATS